MTLPLSILSPSPTAHGNQPTRATGLEAISSFLSRIYHCEIFRYIVSPPVMALAAGLVIILFTITLANAQHDLAEGHDVYKGWVNADGASCCNGSDCGSLEVDEERWQDGHLQIKVEGTWCPVTPGMMVKKSSSPNWSVAHACVWPDWNAASRITPVCQRLKCYKGKGGF